MESMACQGLAVPKEVMQHVVRVESSFNPFAIGVVGGRLVRQPRNLSEALSTVRMLEDRGFNFSLGLAQVNRYNLEKYGIDSYEQAFDSCANLQAGSKILADCYRRAGRDWGKSFSCYYSGNFSTGFRHGYVQKVYASLRQGGGDQAPSSPAIEVVSRAGRRTMPVTRMPLYQAASPAASRIADGSANASTGFAGMPSRVEAVPSPAAVARSGDPPVMEVATTTAATIPAEFASTRHAVVTGNDDDIGRAVVIGSPATAANDKSTTKSDARTDKALIANTQLQDAAFVF